MPVRLPAPGAAGASAVAALLAFGYVSNVKQKLVNKACRSGLGQGGLRGGAGQGHKQTRSGNNRVQQRTAPIHQTQERYNLRITEEKNVQQQCRLGLIVRRRLPACRRWQTGRRVNSSGSRQMHQGAGYSNVWHRRSMVWHTVCAKFKGSGNVGAQPAMSWRQWGVLVAAGACRRAG